MQRWHRKGLNLVQVRNGMGGASVLTPYPNLASHSQTPCVVPLVSLRARVCAHAVAAAVDGRSTDGVGRPYDPAAHDCKLWGWGSNKYGELLQPIASKSQAFKTPILITPKQLGPLDPGDIRSIQSGTTACRVGLAVTCEWGMP